MLIYIIGAKSLWWYTGLFFSHQFWMFGKLSRQRIFRKPMSSMIKKFFPISLFVRNTLLSSAFSDKFLSNNIDFEVAKNSDNFQLRPN